MKLKFISLIFFFLTFLFGFFSPAFVQAADAFQLTGTVTDQNGNGVQNVSVTATDPGGSTTLFGPSVTVSNGSYQLEVDPGTYDFYFTPASGSGLNPIVVNNFTVSADEVISVQLSPAVYIFSGVIRDSQGNPLPNISFNLHLPGQGGGVNFSSDSSGFFSTSAQAALYAIQIRSSSALSFDSVGGVIDLRSGNITHDFALPPSSVLEVTVKDSAGNLVGNTRVDVGKQGQAGFALSPGMDFAANYITATLTNQSGLASFNVPEGMTFSAGGICAEYDINRFCNTSSVTVVSGGASVELIQPENHVFSGIVRDAAGNLVEGAFVKLDTSSGQGEFSTTTNSNGEFSLRVRPLQYRVQVNTPDSTWQFVSGIIFDLRTSDMTQNFQFPTNANVTVIVHDGNGAPIINRQVSAGAGTQNGFSLAANVSVGATVNMNAVTDANGQVIFSVPLGMIFSANGICAQGNTAFCNTSTVSTANGDVSVVLTEPSNHIFSGVLRDASGNFVANAFIELDRPSRDAFFATRTNALGEFSIDARSLEYRLTIRSADSTVKFVSENTAIDLRTADVDQDFQLPTTADVTVIVKDINGDPVEGSRVEVGFGVGGNFNLGSLLSFGTEFHFIQFTNQDGQVVVSVPQGVVLGSNTICARVDVQNLCLAGNLSTANGDVSLVLQPQPAIPTPTSTPTPTDTPTPTPTPANVAPVIGAISASVNPIQVFSSTTTTASFSDTNISDTHTAVWDWGDGLTSTGTITESNGSGSVSDSHVYLTAGVYEITLTVTDSNNASDSDVFQYLSVYNPTPQGLFSGARIFTSPQGAYVANPNLSGQVQFGVTAKYQNDLPTGSVSMKFNAANFEFDAIAITTLVTANGKATLRGTGTVNGAGNYTFLVTGIDGADDTVRFQIRDASNTVVYDSQPGASDTADPTASVTGQVIVH